MTKGKAFILCLVAVMILFFTMAGIVLLYKNPDGTVEFSYIPVGTACTAIGALAAAYITGNVADHGVKGKFWNQQMWDSENQHKRPIETIKGDI